MLIPASIYNGNRNRIEHRGYASGLDRADLYKKDLQLTTSELPQLSPDPGQALQTGSERLQCHHAGDVLLQSPDQTRLHRAGGARHPARRSHSSTMAFCDRRKPDRTRATLVVSAPGVRERKPEFIGFSASPDRGIDWKPGDEVRLRLRIYSFEAPGIPALLDKFMTVRKAVTGPNHPRNLSLSARSFG